MNHGYPLGSLLINALRATVALGFARFALRQFTPHDVIRGNREIARKIEKQPQPHSPARIAQQCDMIGFFINRMAARVPWRSDCLVQAIAGQRLLAAKGIASEIVVGTAKRPDGSFESHAWLRQCERIVLGGDVTSYRSMLPAERAQDHR